MSFGYSGGDVILLTQVAWRTVQNARKACGEYGELTRELQGLHVVIRRLEQEVRRPTCPMNRDPDTYEDELEGQANGCKINLNVLDQVLTKYNALSERERSGRSLWQKIRFGNGEMLDMANLMARLTYYTSAISLFLNIVSTGIMGRVERQLVDAGGDLEEIRIAINGITAELMSKGKGQEGSILTAYADDDTAVWKKLRRELVQDGFTSSVIRKYKKPIMSYIEELGSRGLLDDVNPNNEAEEQDLKDKSVVRGALSPDRETCEDSEASLGPQIEVESSIVSKAPPHSDPKPRTAKPEDRSSPTGNISLRTQSQTKSSADLHFIISYRDLDELFESRVKLAVESSVQKSPFTNFVSESKPPLPLLVSEKGLVDALMAILGEKFRSWIRKYEAELGLQVSPTDSVVRFQSQARLYAVVDELVEKSIHGRNWNFWRRPEGFYLYRDSAAKLMRD